MGPVDEQPRQDRPLTRRSLLRTLGLGAVASGVAVGVGAPKAGAATGDLLPSLDDVVDPAVGLAIGTLGSARSLLADNPVLPAGALAFAVDTHQLFVGDGAHRLVDVTPFEAPSGVELASASDGEQRSFDNVTRDYPNLALGPFTVAPGKAAYVHLFLPNCYLTSAQTFSAVQLVHGTGSSQPEDTPLDDATCLLTGNGLVFTPTDRSTVGRLGPGVHTVKVKVFEAKDAGSTEFNWQGMGKSRLWAVAA